MLMFSNQHESELLTKHVDEEKRMAKKALVLKKLSGIDKCLIKGFSGNLFAQWNRKDTLMVT